jgi:hypothetical protein
MEFKTTLKKDDYVTYHLFQASQTESLKKRRYRHWFGVPVVYFVTGYLLKLLNGPESVQWLFYLTGVVWFILYRFYSKWAIRRFITRQIGEKYADIVDKEGVLNVNDKELSLKNDDNALKVNYKEIKKIYELSSHFLIELENGFTLILPKKTENINVLLECVKEISKKSEQPIIDKLNWRWT